MKNLIELINNNEEKDFAVRVSKAYFEYIRKPFYIGVMGKAGAGKSSIINTLCQANVCRTGGVGGCTREVQEIDVKLGDIDIRIFDFPGIAENQEWDKQYLETYKSSLKWLDMVIWVSKVDDRAMFEDEKFIQENFKEGNSHNIKKGDLIFLLSQVDKTEPAREWNYDTFEPSQKQKETIEKNKSRIRHTIHFKMNLGKDGIVQAIDVANSFYTGNFFSYNFDSLVNQIVNRVSQLENMPSSLKRKLDSLDNSNKVTATATYNFGSLFNQRKLDNLDNSNKVTATATYNFGSLFNQRKLDNLDNSNKVNATATTARNNVWKKFFG